MKKKTFDAMKIAKLTENKAFNTLMLVTLSTVFLHHGLEERLTVRRGRIPEVAKHRKFKL
jgi:hypothetical protein